MRLTLTFLLLPLFAGIVAHAQQFIGMPTQSYTSILQMPYNPAWVTAAENGTEVNLFSLNALIGTNAYRFKKRWIYGHFDGSVSGKAIEGFDYFKETGKGKKSIWGNFDLVGPAASFKIAKNMYVGFYTRMRELANGGNLDNGIFQFLGDAKNAKFNQLVTANDAGFLMHVWGEAGFTFGYQFCNDDYHFWRAGVTVKYIAGFNGASMYSNNTQLLKPSADSFGNLSAEIKINFTSQVNNYLDNDASNDMSSWFDRNGNGSLGFDFGVQYEYHPDHDPNRPTPYLFSIAASINDLGRIKYLADSGSGTYLVNLSKIQSSDITRKEFETIPAYLNRMEKDTLVHRITDTRSFTIQLPTTFRMNLDVNLADHFYVQTDVILSLAKSKSDIFTPSYLGVFTITPRYESKSLMIGVPISYIGWQHMNIGMVARFGPLFVGSASLLSNALRNDLQTLDGYAGITLKLSRRKHIY